MDLETDVCLEGWSGYEDRDSSGFLAEQLPILLLPDN